MISISELRVVEDTFFKCDLSYYKPSLYHMIEKHFNEANDFSEASLVKLKNLMQGNKDMAFNSILAKEIRLLQKEIKSTPVQFDETLWRDMLPKIREFVKNILGLNFRPRLIYFQDSFPEGLISFEKKGASSVTIFEGSDNAGIYFLNKRVSSFFTPLLMIHEQLHSCLSQNKTKEQMYIEWFEEGICMWYSMKIYYLLTRNMDILDLYRQRCYIYSKVKDEHNFTRRYFEYMKIMSRIFLAGGEKLIGKMLVDYLSNKREKINSYLEAEKLEIGSLPKSELDNFLVNFTFFIEPEKLPPIEYILLEEVSEPKGINELSSTVKAPQELIAAAIIALQMKGMVFAKNDKIEINWRKRDLLEKGLIKPYWPLNN